MSGSIPVLDARARLLQLKTRYTLTDVIRTIPLDCFRRSPRKAFAELGLTLAAVMLGYLAMHLAGTPWFLPVFWVFTGTAMTGLFILGHDCAHQAFSSSKNVNSLIGHLTLLPLLYPYHGWRITHDRHHAYTNNADLEEAWLPLTVAEYRALRPFSRFVYSLYRGWFWWLATVWYQFAAASNPWHFAPGKERREASSSILIVALFAAVFLPLVVRHAGWYGLTVYYVIPWLVFHFWKSTFTLIHHTHPDIPYERDAVWKPVSGQLYSTVHCRYPRWVEVLCHDINVHVPHHCSTAIPSYNLRRAYAALRQRWHPFLHEVDFSWRLMSDILRRCYLRDDAGWYAADRR